MNVMELLDSRQCNYEVTEHHAAFTAQKMAQEEHVHGMNVAKPVLVKADQEYFLCVLPACCLIDFEALRGVLGADIVRLADEVEMSRWFEDCDVGAEPPFGSFYGLETIMDDRLEDDDFIVFQGGTHGKAIRMEMAEYQKTEQPRVFSFSYHV